MFTVAHFIAAFALALAGFGDTKALEVSTLSSGASVGTIDVLELYDSGMPTGNLEGIALVSRASCGEFGALDSDRVLFMTRDGGSPNLVYFDEHPCDCAGAENEAEFDVCAASGDLGGGCICLDQDLDGDVDCDDFDPPISLQCVEAVPALGFSAQAGVALLMLLVAAFRLSDRGVN